MTDLSHLTVEDVARELEKYMEHWENRTRVLTERIEKLEEKAGIDEWEHYL